MITKDVLMYIGKTHGGEAHTLACIAGDNYPKSVGSVYVRVNPDKNILIPFVGELKIRQK